MSKAFFKHSWFYLFVSVLGIWVSGVGCAGTRNPKPDTKSKLPNIILISIDDMNTWIGAMGGPAITPHIDELAKQGRLFTNAYCTTPACNPSRVSMMTGLRPETTGQYTNAGNFRNLPNGDSMVTLPQYLRKLGYQAVGAGKTFHKPREDGETPNPHSDPVSWDFQWVGKEGTPGREQYVDANNYGLWHGGDTTINEYLRREGIWGPIPYKDEETYDWQASDFCAQFLQKKHSKPFFLALGISRPHSPQLAPQKYFDMYPLESVKVPSMPEDDLADLPEHIRSNFSSNFVHKVKAKGELQKAMQGVLASMTYADACVGHLLDALEESVYKKNTIVIFWSDHGWQLGQKDRWEKYSLWRIATRAPLIIRYPGMPKAGKPCTQSVSFLDIFPTINELIGQPRLAYLEGHSLRPLLQNPQYSWPYPAVVTYEKGNHSVVYNNYNYIHYKNDTEELYNHISDPLEFKNLAKDSTYSSILEAYKQWLPKTPKQ